MIFTECCYCDEPFTYPYEAGDEGVGEFAKVKCEKCGKNNFVELSSFDGITMSEEYFWEQHPNAQKKNS